MKNYLLLKKDSASRIVDLGVSYRWCWGAGRWGENLDLWGRGWEVRENCRTWELNSWNCAKDVTRRIRRC